jgi:hypothetical protein
MSPQSYLSHSQGYTMRIDSVPLHPDPTLAAPLHARVHARSCGVAMTTLSQLTL